MGDQARRARLTRVRGRLILVKHAQPVVDFTRPARTWPLSDDGRAAAEAFAERLRPLAAVSVVGSPEPKASDTGRTIAQALDLPFALEPGLEEHHRETQPFGSQAEFETRVARMFAQPDRLIFGEETADEAHARFAAAIDRVWHEGARIVVAHGTVIALWAARRNNVDPFPLWRALSMPSAIVQEHRGNEFSILA